MSSDLLQIIYALIGAGSVYGGIRADIRAMHERITEAAASATLHRMPYRTGRPPCRRHEN